MPYPSNFSSIKRSVNMLLICIIFVTFLLHTAHLLVLSTSDAIRLSSEHVVVAVSDWFVAHYHRRKLLDNLIGP